MLTVAMPATELGGTIGANLSRSAGDSTFSHCHGPARPHMHQLKAFGGEDLLFRHGQGLARPPTTLVAAPSKVAGGRASPGHDGENIASSWKNILCRPLMLAPMRLVRATYASTLPR